MPKTSEQPNHHQQQQKPQQNPDRQPQQEQEQERSSSVPKSVFAAASAGANGNSVSSVRAAPVPHQQQQLLSRSSLNLICNRDKQEKIMTKKVLQQQQQHRRAVTPSTHSKKKQPPPSRSDLLQTNTNTSSTTNFAAAATATAPRKKLKEPVIHCSSSKRRQEDSVSRQLEYEQETSSTNPRGTGSSSNDATTTNDHHHGQNQSALLDDGRGNEVGSTMTDKDDGETNDSSYCLAVSESPSELTTPSVVCADVSPQQHSIHAEDHQTNYSEESSCPFGWIEPGMECFVYHHGGENKKKMFSEAKILVPPYERGGRWVVDVIWGWGGKMERAVDCHRCHDVNQCQRADRTRRRSRNRKSAYQESDRPAQSLLSMQHRQKRQQQESQQKRIGSQRKRQNVKQKSGQMIPSVKLKRHKNYEDVHSSPPAQRQRVADAPRGEVMGNGSVAEGTEEDNGTVALGETEPEDKKRSAIMESTETEQDDGLRAEELENSSYSEETRKGGSHKYDQSLRAMMQMPSITQIEAEAALRRVGYPFGIQEAIHELRKQRIRAEARNNNSLVKIGMEIEKSFEDGKLYRGRVIKGPELAVDANFQLTYTWHVKYYDDNDQEDMEWEEIQDHLVEDPKLPLLPCRGRKLHCLELFCGRALVSQAFTKRGWKAVPIDILPESNASLQMDILELDPATHLPFVPDVIWASPPCQTYSILAGGTHRGKEPGSFNKTPESHDHDRLFTKMVQIIAWAMAKHPHLVVVLENPKGLLQHMPLMEELEERVVPNLEKVEVHYCTFGRDEKKPTHLWTNDDKLKFHLRRYTCSKSRCQVHREHVGTRELNRSGTDVAAIPKEMAEEVAHVVDAIFLLDKPTVRFHPASEP
ncbi:hypothetical protein ACA910_011793 [Epithemia clementina (nom. ined.)]